MLTINKSLADLLFRQTFSIVLTGMLQGGREKYFKAFLNILAKEKKDSKFYDATKEFFSGFTMFPGYEEYAAWSNGKGMIS